MKKKEGRRLIIGDIHGAFKSLEDVLKKANFDRDKDTLYAVGDYVDGFPESYAIVKFLKELPNFKGVIGNHDYWAKDWLLEDKTITAWYLQGGAATIDSYANVSEEEKIEHGKFLESLPFSITTEDDIFICHGGAVSSLYLKSLEKLDGWDLMWDRYMFMDFREAQWVKKEVSIEPFKKIFVGHTQTENPNIPFTYGGLWNIDQGAGWSGRLTLVDMDTEEYWQSAPSLDFYPRHRGRNS